MVLIEKFNKLVFVSQISRFNHPSQGNQLLQVKHKVKKWELKVRFVDLIDH